MRVAGDMTGLEQATDKVNAHLTKSGNLMGNALNAGLMAAMAGLAATAAGFGLTAAAGIKFNASLETSTVAFKVLLGSTDLAQERLSELSKFAAATPFELPEIVEGSRVLQVFGGTALATGSNLKMVGDIASGVNRPFGEVALWVGRMYDALKSGRPFGEATARLQEMGALSGEARDRIEKLGKAGGDISQIWPSVSKEFEIFNGMMEEQSSTFSGLMSTLADTFNITAGELSRPLFDKIKESLPTIISGLEIFPSLIGALASGRGFDILYEKINVTFGPETGARIASLLDPLARIKTEGVAALLEFGKNGVIAIAQTLMGLREQFVEWAKAFIDWIGPMIPTMLAELGKVAGELFTWAAAQVGPLIDRLGAWANEFIAWVMPMIPTMLAELGKVASSLLQWVIDKAPGLAEKFLSEWVPAAIGWVAEAAAKIVPELPGILIQIGNWIVTEGVPKLLELAVKLGLAIVSGVVKGLANLGPTVGKTILEALQNIASPETMAANAVTARLKSVGTMSNLTLEQQNAAAALPPTRVNLLAQQGIFTPSELGLAGSQAAASIAMRNSLRQDRAERLEELSTEIGFQEFRLQQATGGGSFGGGLEAAEIRELIRINKLQLEALERGQTLVLEDGGRVMARSNSRRMALDAIVVARTGG